jgi:oxygen-dependent protoporphyrinogen oxidase
MTRIAIIGGGISGLAAAYELELARRSGAAIDWQLYEASDRLGGVVETTRHDSPDGAFGEWILEGGPDAWVSEKPWARELAIELGLESELIYSNDATRKTYILMPEAGTAGKLQPIPSRMRLMVPEDLSALDGSPLFSHTARAAYADELAHAAQLKISSPFVDTAYDESVASFVLRHFGEEVLTKLAAPLLSGVFGGDVAKLSVCAVMPAFVALEREHGSLITALQAKSAQRTQPPQPIFTSLRNGMGSLIDALVAQLPPERLHLGSIAHHISRQDEWVVRHGGRTGHPFLAKILGRDVWSGEHEEQFDNLVIATGLDATYDFLLQVDCDAAALLPTDASSAVLATLCWPAEIARTFTLPGGFGFLVPQFQEQSVITTEAPRSGQNGSLAVNDPQVLAHSTELTLLACTFVDQKFPDRCPSGAHIVRVFFGRSGAEGLTQQLDEAIAATALTQLRAILGPLPAPDLALTTIRHWPRSLPQYEVGHLDRMAQLDALVTRIGNLTLLGNSYRGVGLPDLIRDAREAARRIGANLG